jgi:hypothetical protein
MTLTPGEFIRRFLIHVLPHGFHRIRHYGFLANPVRRRELPRVRQLLADHSIEPNQPTTEEQDPAAPASSFICPSCGTPMIIIETLGKQIPRAPPTVS